MPEVRVLVVDDEKSMRDLLAIMLQKAGTTWPWPTAERRPSSRSRPRASIRSSPISACRRWTACRSSRRPRSTRRDTAVIIVTALASTETAVEAMKLGAYDYITKPFKLDEVNLIIDNALERRRLRDENQLPPEASCETAAPLREHRRQERRRCVDVFDTIRKIGGQPLDRHDHRRERHRQGAGGAAPSTSTASRRGQAVRVGQLRRDARGPDGVRAVRPRARAPSPGRWRTRSASSPRPTAAPCSSTRSRRFRPRLQVKLLRAIQERRDSTGRRHPRREDRRAARGGLQSRPGAARWRTASCARTSSTA